MKSNTKQTTLIKNKKIVNYFKPYSEKLGRIHRKYHPQENDLFDMVDDEYIKRFEMVFGLEEQLTTCPI